jgi:DNA-binding transcriptional LysR family regulator
MNLKYLQQFLELSNHSSMSQYAIHAGVTHAQVSRMVQELEKEFGYRLLIRDKSKINMEFTKKGQTLLTRIPFVFSEIEQMRALINADRDVEKGTFDIYTTTYLIDYWIASELIKFVNVNPNIIINLFHREDTPSHEEKKTLITISPKTEGADDIEQIFLRDFHIGLWASKDYIKRYGRPENINDLTRHKLLCFERKWSMNSYPTINWYMNNIDIAIRPENVTVIRSSIGIMKAAESGLGIFSLSEESVKSLNYDFERILPDFKGPIIPMCLSYPKAWKEYKSIKKIEDFFIKVFKDKRFND